jgi:hypothetical protein
MDNKKRSIIMNLSKLANSIMQMTKELKKELDMSDYSTVIVENGKALFQPYHGPGPSEHVFTDDKIFSLDELNDRAQARKTLGLRMCELENFGITSINVHRSEEVKAGREKKALVPRVGVV